jgi:hypothetical protein
MSAESESGYFFASRRTTRFFRIPKEAQDEYANRGGRIVINVLSPACFR